MGYTTDQINLIGCSLSEGESIRVTCPFCGGGTSGESTLGVTINEGATLYNCFRAKCGVSGAIGGHRHCPPEGRTDKPKPKRRVWEGKSHELPDKVRSRIQTLWGIDEPENWYWTTDYGGRVAMSVRSPKYTHRGWVLRSITNTEGAKALTFIDEGEESASWYKTTPHRGTIIVEDIPSAIRASKHMNAVALLGTNLGPDKALEISDHAPRPLYLALDQDATAKSFTFAKKYAMLWGDVKIIPLKKDLKDMEEYDLSDLLR